MTDFENLMAAYDHLGGYEHDPKNAQERKKLIGACSAVFLRASETIAFSHSEKNISTAWGIVEDTTRFCEEHGLQKALPSATSPFSTIKSAHRILFVKPNLS
ncbi:MAG: hypothetical protein K9G62_05525 [Alphaproteobacteria bacterium]|nr:hypothetical protein [Alphaproteobacteria bacterium]